MNTPATIIEGSTVHARVGELTLKETQSCVWVVEGKETSVIAQFLGVTTRTVKSHVESAMDKLNCHNRPQLVGQLFIRKIVAAKDVALMLCITLTVGAMTGYPRPALAGEYPELYPTPENSPFTVTLPFRVRGSGRGRLRRGRSFRNSRRESDMRISTEIQLDGQPARARALVIGDPANTILSHISVQREGAEPRDPEPTEYEVTSRALYARCQQLAQQPGTSTALQQQAF